MASAQKINIKVLSKENLICTDVYKSEREIIALIKRYKTLIDIVVINLDTCGKSEKMCQRRKLLARDIQLILRPLKKKNDTGFVKFQNKLPKECLVLLSRKA